MLHKNFALLIFTTWLSLFVGFGNCEFPADPKPCKYADSDCLVKAINYFLHEKSQGDKAINLPSIDPLDMGTFKLKQGAQSPVNIDLTFIDNQIVGLHQANAYKTRGFGKDLSKKHELRINVPAGHLTGKYTISGRVLLLPISGSGQNNLTISNANLTIQFVGVPYEKDGQTYMKSDKVKVITDPEKIHFHFGNLFNGDKALGDNMNLFLNDNWKEIYPEVRDSFNEAIAPVFSKLVDSVFATYPYDKFYSE